ncbi:Diacylglycerol O-acyltransferase 1, partial [Geodia barretti]
LTPHTHTHTVATLIPSLCFSSRSGFQNYRGLLNDCILLLVLSNSHNVASNLFKYGILVNPRQWLIYTFNEDTMPAWILLVVSYLFAVLMLVGEKLASKVSHNHTHTNSQH